MSDFSVVGPRLTRTAADFFGENASVCLRKNNPTGQLTLRYTDTKLERRLHVRVHRITRAMRSTYGDLQDATEHGAYGIALLTAATQMGTQLAERSYKGPGFDWYLIPPGQSASDDDIFGELWAFEVSGILKGEPSDVQARLRDKRKQVAEAARLRPTLVAVVEFCEPSTTLELQ